LDGNAFLKNGARHGRPDGEEINDWSRGRGARFDLPQLAAM